jgi:hypothetical protein
MVLRARGSRRQLAVAARAPYAYAPTAQPPPISPRRSV